MDLLCTQDALHVMAPSQVSEPDLLKLLSTATTACNKAATGDAAEEARAVDTLKLLASHAVSSELLMKTDAGKKVKKLAKTGSDAIKSAANAAIDAWKECVRLEQSKKASVAAVDPIKDEGKATAQDCQQLPSGTDRQTSSLTAMASQGSMDFGSLPSPKGGSSTRLIGQPARCNDPTRNKIRGLLAEALAAACSDETPDECDPCKVAALAWS